MKIGYLFRFYFNFIFCIICINFKFSNSTLVIGAIFPTNPNINSTEAEIVFKHAVYVSNQHRMTSSSQTPYNYPILSHNVIKYTDSNTLKSAKTICKETNGKMIGFIGIDDHKTKLSSYVRSLSEELDLIYMDTGLNINITNAFTLYPSVETMCKAFADLIEFFEWTHAAIFYNTKNNLRLIRCLLGGPAKHLPKVEFILKLTNEGDDYRNILKDLIRRKITNVIIDLPPAQAQVLLRKCLQLGMINGVYHYILTTLDIETMDLEDLRYNRVNLTAFRLIKTNSEFHNFISTNLTDYISNNPNNIDIEKLLHKAENALLFDSVFALSSAIKDAEKSIDFDAGSVSCNDHKAFRFGDALSSSLEKISITGLSGHIKFENRQRKSIDLDVLQLKEIGLVESGKWSPHDGLNFTFLHEVYEEIVTSKKIIRVATVVPRVDQTLVLKVATKTEEPYVMERPDGEFEGFCIDILKEVAQRMNFKYELYKVPDNRYGSELPNGSWDGLVKELIEKKADLAVASLTINFKRQQVVDFTKPFISLGISILFKVPTSEKPGLFSFLSPLALEIWIYTLTAYLAVSFILMTLARFSPYEWRHPHPCQKDSEYLENTFNLSNSLWFAIGTLMQQGSDINPKAFSTRLVSGVWWFFTLIIISSYTANLAAFLTVERVVLPIQNVEDLANQKFIQYGTLYGGSTMGFFKESTLEIYQNMWRHMQTNPHNFVQSTEEGIDRVLKRNYAFFMESTMIDYNVQKNCNLTQIGGFLDSKGYGIAAQRGSPYTEEISLKLLEMQEKGIIQQLYNRWWKGQGICLRDEKKDSKANPLGVQNVGGIFVVLIGGLVFAIFVSVCEFVYHAKKHLKHSKKSLCRIMTDEMRFAIQCGGSTKKPALVRQPPSPKKCKECQREAKKKNIQLKSDHICNHHTSTSLSVAKNSTSSNNHYLNKNAQLLLVDDSSVKLNNTAVIARKQYKPRSNSEDSLLKQLYDKRNRDMNGGSNKRLHLPIEQTNVFNVVHTHGHHTLPTSTSLISYRNTGSNNNVDYSQFYNDNTTPFNLKELKQPRQPKTT